MSSSQPRSPAPISTQIVVRFRDCDPMGHVNNAVYLTYFEIARVEFWHRVMRPQGAGDWPFILAEATVTFRSPATVGDTLIAEIDVDSIGTRSWVFRYRIVNARDGREVATGRSVQVAYDYGAGKSVALPAELRRKLQEQAALARSGSNP